MMIIGTEVVAETVEAIFSNNFTAIDQPDKIEIPLESPVSIPAYATRISTNEAELKKAPKIFRNDCRINWQQEASSVHNFIRGLSPYPGSFSVMDTQDTVSELKVLKSALTIIPNSGAPGNVVVNNSKLLVGCSEKYLELIIIQPSGKKAMPAIEFLRGLRSEIVGFV
jgi:methionyl-tRNA formyltransferase